MSSRLTVIRDVSKDECPWLDEPVKAGTTVYRYSGATYGCISRRGTAVSWSPGETPFFELPAEALAPYQTPK